MDQEPKEASGTPFAGEHSHEADAEATGDPWAALERMFERRDRDYHRHDGRDGEGPRQDDFLPARGTEPSPRRDARIPAGLAYDRLAGRYIRPFKGVPVRVRERVERMTGRTLEESYEGFTSLVASAVYEYLKEDMSRDARKRRSARR